MANLFDDIDPPKGAAKAGTTAAPAAASSNPFDTIDPRGGGVEETKAAVATNPPQMFLSQPDASGRRFAEPSTQYNIPEKPVGIVERAREGAGAPMEAPLGFSPENLKKYPWLSWMQPGARIADTALRTPASIWGGVSGAVAGAAEPLIGSSNANRLQRDVNALPLAVAPEVPIASAESSALRRPQAEVRPPVQPPRLPAQPPPLPPEASAIPRQIDRPDVGVGLLRADVPHELPGAQSRGLSATGNGGPLSGMSPETVTHLRQTMADQGFTPHTIDQRLAEMSAHHFFGEITPSLEADMGAMAAPPGPGKLEVLGSIRQRSLEARERTQHEFDRAFGVNENVAQLRRIMEGDRAIASDPFYRQFRATEVSPTPAIDALMPRLQASGALQAANRALEIEGIPSSRGFLEMRGGEVDTARVPTAQAFQYAKEYLDKQIDAAIAAPGGINDARRYTALKNDLIAALDNHPLMGDTWRQARTTYAQPTELMDAMHLGQRVLTNHIHADDLPFLTASFSEPQMRALRIGMRGQIEQVLGKRSNLTAEVMNTVLSPNNVQKLRWAIGDAATDSLVAAMEHEQHMHGAPTRVHGGSPTAHRLEAQKRWTVQAKDEGMTLGDVAGAIRHPFRTAATAGVGAAEKFGVGRRRAANEARMARLREESSRIYTLQGPERDAVARYLVEGGGGYKRGGRVDYAGGGKAGAAIRMLRTMQKAPRKTPKKKHRASGGSVKALKDATNDLADGGDVKGMLKKGTIDLTNRPVVHNDDGSISTVRSIGANVDGVETLLPTVYGQSVLSNDDAVRLYRMSGQHLGQFDTPDNSDAYARQLHDDQAEMYRGRASGGRNLATGGVPDATDFYSGEVLPADGLPDAGEPLVGDGGQFSAGTKTGNRLFGTGGEERYQTWPEKLIRSAATLPHDVMTGEVPQWEVDPATGEAHTSAPMIERTQDLAGTAGGAGLGKMGEAAIEASTRAPSMRQFWKAAPEALSDSAAPGAPLAALEHAPRFYSHLENTVKELPFKTGTGDQLLGTLTNKGVKLPELEATGTLDLLKSKGAEKISKDELLAHIEQNKVELGSVRKGDTPWEKLSPERQDRVAEDFRDIYPDQHTSSNPDWGAVENFYNQRRAEGEYNVGSGEGGTKFSEYQLPGANNYQEKLLTLPQNRFSEKDLPQGWRVEPSPHSPTFRVMEGEEILGYGVTPNSAIEQALADTGTNPKAQSWFQSSHWDEPNVLVHTRSNEREVNGVPSHHIEEIQSDWHQKGRKQGYQGDKTDLEKQLEAHRDKLVQEYIDLSDKQSMTRAELKRHEDIQDEINAVNSKLEQFGSNQKGVPNAPFKSNWHELAVKDALRDAAEKGLDRISWTPGEAQAARYDLSKQVQALWYQKNPDGTFKVSAHPLGSESMRPLGQNLTEAQLADHVGKEVAEKITKGDGNSYNLGGNSTSQPADHWNELTGVDLKVGGEGMKGFYDKMVPNYFNKIGKAHGVKVERGETHTPGSTMEYDGPAPPPEHQKAYADYVTQDIARRAPELEGPWKGVMSAMKQGKDFQEAMTFRGTLDLANFLGGDMKLAGEKAPVHYMDIPQSLKDQILQKGFSLFEDSSVGAPLAALEHSLTDQHGQAIKGKDYSKASREALDTIAKGPKGAGPLDLASMNEIPNVPQQAMERYTPARGVSPRLQDALQNPEVKKGIQQSIATGIKMGADKWYHNEPIRRAFVAELGPEQGQKAFIKFADMVSATSPRSDVPTNIRNASFYYLHALNGAPLPKNLVYPYGHVAQNLHRQNFETLTGPRASALSAGAPEATTAWDIFKNPKPASFSQNLQGNLVPGTMDTHAFRNIAMRTGDPRFLETSITQLNKSTNPGEASMASRFGEVKGDKVIYRPQKLVEQGKLAMDEAKDIPSFWSSKPNENEYAAAETLYRELGKKAGIPTADAQAAAWSGAGQLTGLGTVATHTFPELFNERVLYTAIMRNEDPTRTLQSFIRGQKPLLSLAGVGIVVPFLFGGDAEASPAKRKRGGKVRSFGPALQTAYRLKRS